MLLAYEFSFQVGEKPQATEERDLTLQQYKSEIGQDRSKHPPTYTHLVTHCVIRLYRESP